VRPLQLQYFAQPCIAQSHKSHTISEFLRCCLQATFPIVSSMKLLVYETNSGKRPFVEWFGRLDGRRQASVRRRLRAAEEYNHLGDYSSLRGGLYEMRLAGRIGLRVYFANIDGAIVLLLGGSGKSDQTQAIKRSRERLKDFRDRNSD